MWLLESNKTLFTTYQYIKTHSYFEKYFIPDRSRPSYSWNFPWHLMPISLSAPMLMKYQYGQLYTDLYMRTSLILEG